MKEYVNALKNLKVIRPSTVQLNDDNDVRNIMSEYQDTIHEHKEKAIIIINHFNY